MDWALLLLLAEVVGMKASYRCAPSKTICESTANCIIFAVLLLRIFTKYVTVNSNNKSR